MVKETFLEANGLRFRALEQGQGPLVLLLHGFPESSYSWRHQLPVLAEAGFRAVAPDLRGYGGTDRPTRVRDYDIDRLADDVVGLVAALGADRAHVVGHDWGGAISWHLASRTPEVIDRLAVLNCPHPGIFLDVLRRSWAQKKRSWYMLFFQLPWLPEWAIRRRSRKFAEDAFRGIAARPERFTDEDIQHYADAFAVPGAARAGIHYYRAALRVGPRTLRVRARLWRRPLEMPTCLIWGTQDTALGEELVDPHLSLAPRMKIVRIPTAGHWVQQEEPELVNEALVEFLGGHR